MNKLPGPAEGAMLVLGTAVPTQVGGDGDAFIEPNETWSFAVPLENNGDSVATNVTAVLSSSTIGVQILAGTSSYPDIVQAGNATNTNAFVVAFGGAAPCGGTADFSLTVSHDGNEPEVFNFTEHLGEPGDPVTFSYTGPPVAIPDSAGIDVAGNPATATLAVTGVGALYDVNFRFDGSTCTSTKDATTVGLTHSFVNDLEIHLISPAASNDVIINRTDGGGNNFCQTVLDDEGGGLSIQSVSSSQNPFTGTFTPNSPLSVFQGEDADGSWSLTIIDFFVGDTGSIRAWSVILTPAICDVTPAPTHLAAQKSVTGGDRTEGGDVVYTILLTNTGGVAQGDNPGNELTDVLPSDLTLTNASSDVGTVTTGVNTVFWNGSLGGNSTASISITASIHAGTAGHTVANQATFFFDNDGNGTNESTGTSDDPGVNGTNDVTVFTVLSEPAAPTTITLDSAPNPSTYGTNIHFVATVSPSSATGTVSILDDGIVRATTLIGSGQATFDLPDFEVATHPITAQYAGSSTFAGSTSDVLEQVVNRAPTTTTLASSGSPADVGDAITFTATISPARASGTVTFSDGDTVIGTASAVAGTASLTVSDLGAGTHSITATSDFPSRYLSSTSNAVSQVVGSPAPTATTTLLEASANPTTFGGTLTLTATVTPAGASGGVTFFDDTTALATVDLGGNGTATFITTALAGGSHPLTAQYLGGGTFAGSTSNTIAMVVNAATTATTLASAANPASAGAIAFTVTVTSPGGEPDGTAQLLEGSTVIATGDVSKGSATLSATLAAGTHTLTAKFVASASFATSTSTPLSQMVTAAVVVDAGPGASPDAGSVGSAPDAPPGSTSADAGQGSSSPDARVSTTTPDAPSSAGASSGDGGCNVGGSQSQHGSAAWLLIVGLFVLGRARRRI